MKNVAMMILAGAVALTAPAYAAAEHSDDKIMTMMALEWAGMNCGKMVPMEDLMRASEFMAKIEKRTWYLKRLKATLEKASTHEVACKSLKEALGPEISSGKRAK